MYVTKAKFPSELFCGYKNCNLIVLFSKSFFTRSLEIIVVYAAMDTLPYVAHEYNENVKGLNEILRGSQA